MENKIKLRPYYYACVSGGKDSLYMLYHILKNKDKYPLDMVVHFDLGELDYPFIKNVCSKIEELCNKLNIKYISIKPTKNFKSLFEKYGYPTRKARWCNSKYKLDCSDQIKKLIKSWNCRPVGYIGLCRNEEKRFKYNLGDYIDSDIIYPLAEDNIFEDKILEWAKQQEIFNNFYNYFNRCGCIGCPMTTIKEWAYLYQNYKDRFFEIMEMIQLSEIKYNYQYFYYTLDKFIEKVSHYNIKISLF